MRIPVPSPWLPGAIGVTQTVLVILAMTGLFPDRPHIVKIGISFSIPLAVTY